MPRFVFLYTDAVIWVIVLALALYARHAACTPELAARWKKLAGNKTALFCAGLLSVFFAVALADSVHFRPRLDVGPTGVVAYAPKTVSVLDYFVGEHIAGTERSYSAPFSLFDFDKTSALVDQKPVRRFARLKGASPDVSPEEKGTALATDFGCGAAVGLGFSVLLLSALAVLRRKKTESLFQSIRRLTGSQNPLNPILWVWTGAFFVAGLLWGLWPSWHIFGTDAVGNDVLLSAVKSVRTGVVIGSLATACMLPPAIIFGIAAGYFKGRVDDVIQYSYTTITSIPSVLLIAASVLMIQVFIDTNPSLYQTGLERADLRLFSLSAIIGVTSWAGLARLLRAETMKLSETDFITAAQSFGVSPVRIMARHIFPNVAHIVLIVAVLDFSGIVLYEAVLSYVGVGVDPAMASFGSMINSAASEMGRTPTVWWNLAASLLFMVALVLSANLFASGVREVFDPRAKRGRRRA